MFGMYESYNFKFICAIPRHFGNLIHWNSIGIVCKLQYPYKQGRTHSKSKPRIP